MTSKRLLLATRSAGKLRELRPLVLAAGFAPIDLREAGIPWAPAEEEIEEFATFEENAMAKAKYFHGASGLPSIADDSGLAVDVLGGAPGVRSKRWSGRVDLAGQALDDANNARLVDALLGRGEVAARYVCVAAYTDEVGTLTARGETVGKILSVARGVGGFGYDPYFWSSDLGATFGERTVEQKEAVSHRGRAVRRLLAEIAVGR